MKTNYNRGYCFNCGEPVEEGNYEDISPDGPRVWVCEKTACHHKLQDDQRDEYEYNKERHMREFEDRYRF